MQFFLIYRPTFYRIYKRKSTEGFQSIPYSVSLFSAMLYLYYAYLKDNEILLITINSFGFGIELMYLIVFMTYATRESKVYTFIIYLSLNLLLYVWNYEFRMIYLIKFFIDLQIFTTKLLVFFNVFIYGAIIVLTYQLTKNDELRLKIVGWICAVFSVSVFAAPLSIMVRLFYDNIIW